MLLLLSCIISANGRHGFIHIIFSDENIQLLAMQEKSLINGQSTSNEVRTYYYETFEIESRLPLKNISYFDGNEENQWALTKYPRDAFELIKEIFYIEGSNLVQKWYFKTLRNRGNHILILQRYDYVFNINLRVTYKLF